MAKVPVMAALSRRPARPSPVHRSLVMAVGLIGLGVAAIVVADPNGDHVRPLVLISGMVAMIVGLVFVAPGAIRAVGLLTRRLPFAPRLALRDLVRHQARTAGAVAAITLGLGIAVSIVVLAKLNEYRADEGNLSSRQLVVQTGGDRAAVLDPNLAPAERARLEADVDAIATAVGSRQVQVVPLDVAVNPASAAANRIIEPITVVLPVDHGYRDVDQPYVATPAVLAHLGIDPGSIEPTTELLTSVTRDVLLIDTSVRPDGSERRRPVQRVSLSRYSSAPQSLITERAMVEHGWVAARAGWLIESAAPLTPAQISSARQAAARAGLTVEVRSSQDALAGLRTGSTVVGGLLALAIVAMAIGLLRGEAAGDLRTLTATGAPASTRRALTAATAGTLALLGVVLSIAGAYATVVAAYHGQLDRLVPLPLAHLLLLAVGLPAVATAGGWLLAGREPRSFARQAPD